ncbi:hypothetical protein ACRN9F_23575 [Shewanella oncorhynchi]|uniref:hypothetical protein n=2 Tax=Shewanellaceae TaxID=267890 RepID=UPI00217EF53B|nr:hypothetical protein [Shewanella baltica]MCS6159837.1 hypothetical protein [Shewanella baltica]MCS6207384.1 hypothetical protein [Shewanella baltica]
MDTKAELEEAWGLLRDTIYNDLDVDSDREYPICNPFKNLSYCLEFGMYPPPEVLISISETYERYMARKGEIDLEEAFFGKPQKGNGNFSSKSHKESNVHMLQLFLSLNNVTDKKSQYEVASEYLAIHKSDEDPEHLLRKFRRYRKASKQRI